MSAFARFMQGREEKFHLLVCKQGREERRALSRAVWGAQEKYRDNLLDVLLYGPEWARFLVCLSLCLLPPPASRLLPPDSTSRLPPPLLSSPLQLNFYNSFESYHMRRWKPKYPFSCNRCCVSFPSQPTLEKHSDGKQHKKNFTREIPRTASKKEVLRMKNKVRRILDSDVEEVAKLLLTWKRAQGREK
jgi:hypothetical protein